MTNYEQVTAWKCPYCSKTSLSKSSISRHVNHYCKGNRYCKSCRYFQSDHVTVYNRYHGGEPGSTDYERLEWWCSHPDIDKELENLRCNCSQWEKKQENGDT